jgi:hypothetical protein
MATWPGWARRFFCHVSFVIGLNAGRLRARTVHQHVLSAGRNEFDNVLKSTTGRILVASPMAYRACLVSCIACCVTDMNWPVIYKAAFAFA